MNLFCSLFLVKNLYTILYKLFMICDYLDRQTILYLSTLIAIYDFMIEFTPAQKKCLWC